MKKVIVLLQWTVGLLFIFSGLVKINDPLGLSYKMEEFFEVWQWLWLKPYTLTFSLIMNGLEVIAGFALLIGWQKKLNTRFLLLLILFFTFLTGYAVFSGKIKTCGCFGDCIPLTAIQSFIKDIVLLFAIVLLTIHFKHIKSVGNNKIAIPLLLGVAFVCGDLQFLVLKYLPYLDCLPYKKGNDIVLKMQKPSNYIADSIVIQYTYTKDNNVIEFDANSFPENFDSTYIFIGRKDKVIREATNAPAIQDFSLFTEQGKDTTSAIFKNPKAIWIMANAMPANMNVSINAMQKLKNFSIKNNIPVYFITSLPLVETAPIVNMGIPILKADATVIKTAARVNATIFCMRNSQIVSKNSIFHFDMIEKNLELLLK
jgi:uncharacterized membrane protein YphA (DoxX/SURF4 family)